MQQFRECLTGEERYRCAIHDRDYLLEARGSFAEGDRTANSENTRAVIAPNRVSLPNELLNLPAHLRWPLELSVALEIECQCPIIERPN
jgi:hypothetical protein